MNIANEWQNSQCRPDQTIDPLTTSYRQLKEMVCSTAGQTLPSAKSLRESGAEQLFTFEHLDGTLTVFANGFFIYECYGKETVSAVDRCKQMIYEYQDGEIRRLGEADFIDGPCLIPLLVKGEDRVVENMDRYERYWHEFSLSHNGEDWVIDATTRSAENDYLHNEDYEIIRQEMEYLTKRQRQIVHLYYYENLTEEQIAALLSVSHQNVSQALLAAKKKIRKNF